MIPEFDDIYAENRWNDAETRSGPGSTAWATKHIQNEITYIARVYKPKRVLDAGCGEGFWMPDLPGYVGVDATQAAIDRARSAHPDRAFLVGDLRTGLPILPCADMVISRDMMQHLPLEDGLACLKTFVATGTFWLLASTFRDGENEDVPVGGAYRINLEVPPFNLGPPVEWIEDGRMSGRAKDDAVKGLGLWPVP